MRKWLCVDKNHQDIGLLRDGHVQHDNIVLLKFEWHLQERLWYGNGIFQCAIWRERERKRLNRRVCKQIYAF